jgi:hypothetical protein
MTWVGYDHETGTPLWYLAMVAISLWGVVLGRGLRQIIGPRTTLFTEGKSTDYKISADLLVVVQGSRIHLPDRFPDTTFNLHKIPFRQETFLSFVETLKKCRQFV